MTDRPRFNLTIKELETLRAKRGWDRYALSRLRAELTHGNTDRARALLRDVDALLSGAVKMRERALAEDLPENQIDLLSVTRRRDRDSWLPCCD